MNLKKEIGILVILVIVITGSSYLHAQDLARGPSVRISDKLTLSVEIADTQEKKIKGLSGKESLTDNEGMLFPYVEPKTPPFFWMKGMLIAIDIIWIKDGEIIQIDHSVQPQPEASDYELNRYTPNVPVDYVLEVRGGLSKEKGIEVSDTVLVDLES